jgi:hypothetical protein
LFAPRERQCPLQHSILQTSLPPAANPRGRQSSSTPMFHDKMKLRPLLHGEGHFLFDGDCHTVLCPSVSIGKDQNVATISEDPGPSLSHGTWHAHSRNNSHSKAIGKAKLGEGPWIDGIVWRRRWINVEKVDIFQQQGIEHARSIVAKHVFIAQKFEFVGIP